MTNGNRSLRLAFALLLAGVTFAPMTNSFGSGVSFAGLQAQTAGAVVAIETQAGRGSGFLIDSAGLVVTACHVVNVGVRLVERDGQALRVVEVLLQDDPRTYLAMIENGCQPLGTPAQSAALTAAARDDVAVLRIIGYQDGDQLHPLSSPTGFQRLWFASQPPSFTETVFVAGFGGPFAEASFLEGSFGGTLSLVTAATQQIQAGLGLLFGNVVPRNGSGSAFNGGNVGLVVTDLLEGGLAAAAGVRPGDVVIEIDGQAFDLSQASATLSSLAVGDALRLTLTRGDETFQVQLAAAEVAFSRVVRFVDSLWCFAQRTDALTQSDFLDAEFLDLIKARNTLALAAGWARGCGMMLATAFGANGSQPAFEFVGRVTEIAESAFAFEELSARALTPLGGDLVEVGRSGKLEESHFLKVTALSGPGFSGGPVLNASGQVIGFVDFGLGDPAPGYLVTAEAMQAHLRAIGAN